MNMILILLLAVQSGSAGIHGVTLQQEISIDAQIAVGEVLQDGDGITHILVTTLSSVRSYNLEGKMEWVISKARYFADKTEYPVWKSNYTMLYSPINDSLANLYIVSLKSGKATDSTLLKSSAKENFGLDQAILMLIPTPSLPTPLAHCCFLTISIHSSP